MWKLNESEGDCTGCGEGAGAWSVFVARESTLATAPLVVLERDSPPVLVLERDSEAPAAALALSASMTKKLERSCSWLTRSPSCATRSSA